MLYLKRCIQLFRKVQNLLWIVVEDAARKDAEVEDVFKKSGLQYHYFNVGPTHHKGKEQKNLGMSFVRDNRIEGVVYVADDDNYYEKKLFDELQKTKRIAIFPVGNLGPNGTERPVIRKGKIVGWDATWRSRKYPTDWAGIAFDASILQKLQPPILKNLGPGGETEFLEQCIRSSEELELLCSNCSRCYVRHNEPLTRVSRLQRWLRTILWVCSLTRHFKKNFRALRKQLFGI